MRFFGNLKTGVQGKEMGSTPATVLDQRGAPLSGSLLFALALLLPFEPREALRLGGLEFTLLEVVAGLVMLAIAWAQRATLYALLRRPPLAVVLMGGYALTNLLSAAAASDNRVFAFKFALRMVAAASLALLVAATPWAARRAALRGLLGATCLAATLCILEWLGVSALDPVLDLFRGSGSHVGGVPRATGGSESPNLAAAFLMRGLVISTSLAESWAGPAALAVSTLLSLGLLGTYSRGSLAAAAIGLATCAAALRARDARIARASLQPLLVLAGVSLVVYAASDSFRLRFGAEGAAAWYGLRYEAADESLALSTSERRTLSLRLINTGGRAWSDGLRLCSRWYDVDRKRLAPGACVVLAPGLAPGSGLDLPLGVSAPEQAGRYFLVWDVHDSGTWLSVRGVAPAVIPASVQHPGGPVPPLPQQEERPAVAALSAAWPHELSGLDRRELWQAAYAMWREHPWLGVGPDNFRWLQGRYTAQQFPQTFVFANNSYAEAAATTGTLGLLALLGTLLSSAAAAARRVASADSVEEARFAAVCLGLVACVAAHGLIDHVLEFTGHYLFLGLLVGVIAGTPRAARVPSTLPPG